MAIPKVSIHDLSPGFRVIRPDEKTHKLWSTGRCRTCDIALSPRELHLRGRLCWDHAKPRSIKAMCQSMHLPYRWITILHRASELCSYHTFQKGNHLLMPAKDYERFSRHRGTTIQAIFGMPEWIFDDLKKNSGRRK